MDFDLTKENIQPLRGGRSLSHLETALHAQFDIGSEKELHNQQLEYEKQIESYVGDDPIDLWYNYILWLEQVFSKHNNKEKQYQVLQNCLEIFENDERYRQDRRFCKLWIKFIDLQENKMEMFNMLHSANICTECADFYRAWAFYLEMMNDFKGADQIFQMAFKNNAQPIEELQIAYKNLTYAAGLNFLGHGVNKNQLEEQRKALTSLKTYKHRHTSYVTSVRTNYANNVPPGSSNYHRPAASSSDAFSNQVSSKIELYSDQDPREGALLTPGTNIHINSIVNSAVKPDVTKENTIKPGTWNKPYKAAKKSLILHTTTSSSKATNHLDFKVHQDDENSGETKPSQIVDINIVPLVYPDDDKQLYHPDQLTENQKFQFKFNEIYPDKKFTGNVLTEMSFEEVYRKRQLQKVSMQHYNQQNFGGQQQNLQPQNQSQHAFTSQFTPQQQQQFVQQQTFAQQFAQQTNQQYGYNQEVQQNNQIIPNNYPIPNNYQQSTVPHSTAYTPLKMKMSDLKVTTNTPLNAKPYEYSNNLAQGSQERQMIGNNQWAQPVVWSQQPVDNQNQNWNIHASPAQENVVLVTPSSKQNLPGSVWPTTSTTFSNSPATQYNKGEYSTYTKEAMNEVDNFFVSTQKSAQFSSALSDDVDDIGTKLAPVTPVAKRDSLKFHIHVDEPTGHESPQATSSQKVNNFFIYEDDQDDKSFGFKVKNKQLSYNFNNEVYQQTKSPRTPGQPTVVQNMYQPPTQDIANQNYPVPNSTVYYQRPTPQSVYNPVPPYNNSTSSTNNQYTPNQQPPRAPVTPTTYQGYYMSENARTPQKSEQTLADCNTEIFNFGLMATNNSSTPYNEKKFQQRSGSVPTTNPLEYSIYNVQNQVGVNKPGGYEGQQMVVQKNYQKECDFKQQQQQTNKNTLDKNNKNDYFNQLSRKSEIQSQQAKTPKTIQQISISEPPQISSKIGTKTPESNLENQPKTPGNLKSLNTSKKLSTIMETTKEYVSSSSSSVSSGAATVGGISTTSYGATPGSHLSYGATKTNSIRDQTLPAIKEVVNQKSTGMEYQIGEALLELSQQHSPPPEQRKDKSPLKNDNKFQRYNSDENFYDNSNKKRAEERRGGELYYDTNSKHSTDSHNGGLVSVQSTQDYNTATQNRNVNYEMMEWDADERSNSSTQYDYENSCKKLDEMLASDRPINPFETRVIDLLLKKIRFPYNYTSVLSGDEISRYESIQNVSKPCMKDSITLNKDRYFVEKLLGRGTYGIVVRAADLNTTCTVALKYQKPPNKWEYYICREIQTRLQQILESKLRHNDNPSPSICSDIRPIIQTGFMNVEKGFFSQQASMFVSEFSKFGSLLNVANKVREATGKQMKELVIFHFVGEMIEIINALHKCQIIHADIKPDNFLVMALPPFDAGRFSLQLIDFGCSIDMSLFPSDIKFYKMITTEDFTCTEMRDGKPWTYQTDLYCMAATAYVLLMGEYMKVARRKEIWTLSKRLPRYCNANVWNVFFNTLINIPSCDQLPNLMEFQEQFNQLVSEKQYDLINELKNIANIMSGR